MAKHLSCTVALTFALFLLINTHFCDGRREEEESSAAVVKGSVFCDKCSQHSLHSPTTYFIPGATIAVECSINRKIRASIRVEGRTDESGEFRIELPSSISNMYSGCSVEVINSPDGSCNVPSVGKLALTLNGQAGNAYCAGLLSYRPQIVPSSCFVEEEDSQQLPSFVRGREALESDETSKQTVSPPLLPNFIPPLPSIPTLNVPPLPSIPTLKVPPLPSVPTLNAPPLPSVPTLQVPPVPRVPTLQVPPLPSVPTVNVPPLPSVPTVNVPPLPNIPTFGFPPLPNIPFNIPPIPFFTPPPPSK